MVYLHVTFQLEAQNVGRFETFYAREFLPVIQAHGFEAVGIFKTLVGRAGEVTEIWRFRDLQDYVAQVESPPGRPESAEDLRNDGPHGLSAPYQ